MKIRRTRLELERIDSMDQVLKVMTTTGLRYKTIYAVNLKPNSSYRNGSTYSIPFRSPYVLYPSDRNILNEFMDMYVIRRTKERNPTQTYTQSELRVMISIFSRLLSEKKFQVAEELCHAIGNIEILEAFYSDYGKMEKTRRLCSDLVDSRDPIRTVSETSEIFPMQFQRPRYSILRLSKDLQEGNAYICTDPDLTGKFTKISRGLKSGATPLLDIWNPVVGCSFNSTRANLSLLYLGKVGLDIPDNEFGVKPGPIELKTLRSICLVKDGKVCNDAFGVRIDSGKIRKRLKASGILKEDLLFPGDFAARISNLPVVSKSDFKNIRIFDLAESEVWSRLSDIALEYLRRREYKERNSLQAVPLKLQPEPIGDAEKFLASLGVYGDYYNPKKTVDYVERSYIASELVCNIKNLPTKETCTSNITKLLNSAPKVNQVVGDFISAYVIPEINGGNYSDLISKWEMRKEECRQKIRELKFRLISGKSLNVVVHGGSKFSILDVTESYKVPSLEAYPFMCKWSINNKEVLV